MATVKHTAPPATAKQILSTIRSTKKDREVVDRVLVELGYTPSGQKLHGKGALASAAGMTAKATVGKPLEGKLLKKDTRKASPRKSK
jgi:hypothetical protein